MNDTIIVWLRNDLRISDNEALFQATKDAKTIIPIYCLDTRQFRKTKYGFRKTGSFRAKFLLESLQDLRFSMQDLGGNLIVRVGKPEEIVFALAKYHKAKAVYCQQEATEEETNVEDILERNLESLDIPLELFWGQTLYHYDDLPYEIEELPDVFTTFRKQVERKLEVRPTFPKPQKIAIPKNIDAGQMPTLADLGFEETKNDKRSVLAFRGGETAALLRLKYYFWEGNHLYQYKETRNELLGANYSSKFSAWLANGCLSPRTIFEEIKRYEKERIENKSTYWLYFELLWRDYFRFVAVKYGKNIFLKAGIKQEKIKGTNDKNLFRLWCEGKTGIPFVDANMRELKKTGFMSNRGRQNVASFLVHDLHLNWQMGAAYFESLLIDYDPCSNYGNWNYVAGIGNDPRPNRKFNVVGQAKRYDQQGDFVKTWCPELRKMPSSRIHQPFLLNKTEQKYLNVHLGQNYPKPCVILKK